MRLDEIDQTHVNAFIASQRVATKTVNNRLTVLSTMLRHAGPSGCKLIPETELRFHVEAMSPDVAAVPIAEVAKLIAAATDHRYLVAVLLASESGLRIGEIRGLQHTDVRDGQLTVRRAIDQHGNAGDQGAHGSRLDRHDHALRDRHERPAGRGHPVGVWATGGQRLCGGPKTRNPWRW